MFTFLVLLMIPISFTLVLTVEVLKSLIIEYFETAIYRIQKIFPGSKLIKNVDLFYSSSKKANNFIWSNSPLIRNRKRDSLFSVFLVVFTKTAFSMKNHILSFNINLSAIISVITIYFN